MNGIFRMDGPLYRIGNIIYYLMVTNFLWIVFSLPIFTIGASTTAMYYIMGKLVRDDDVRILKDYWKSFKNNFKQATAIWLIMLIAGLIIYTNIRNITLLGDMGKIIYPLQLVVLIELVIIAIYIFPLLSRYEMKTKNLFKTAFFMGNRHIFTTILCIACIFILNYLFYQIPGVLILLFISLNALCIYYLVYRIFIKYVPDEKKKDDELEED